MFQQTSRPNPWMVSTLILLGIIAGFLVSKIPYFNSTQQAAVVKEDIKKALKGGGEPAGLTLTEEQIKTLSDDDTVIGDVNAPITMVGFSDFQCGFCAKFAKYILPLIEENYIKTGKVKFIFRDFPLDFHGQAQIAAQASECADEQGKFREMHDAMFEAQQEWSDNSQAPKLIKNYAKRIGLDVKQFNECLDTNKYTGEIRKDLIDGMAVGVSGTPTFFVNGKYVSGSLPYETIFKPIFDAELGGKKWEVQYNSMGIPSAIIE